MYKYHKRDWSIGKYAPKFPSKDDVPSVYKVYIDTGLARDIADDLGQDLRMIGNAKTLIYMMAREIEMYRGETDEHRINVDSRNNFLLESKPDGESK